MAARLRRLGQTAGDGEGTSDRDCNYSGSESEQTSAKDAKGNVRGNKYVPVSCHRVVDFWALLPGRYPVSRSGKSFMEWMERGRNGFPLLSAGGACSLSGKLVGLAKPQREKGQTNNGKAKGKLRT